MTQIRETVLDVSTMTLCKRIMPAGALAEVTLLCRVPDIAAANDPAIDAAIHAFDWTGAQGVYVLDMATYAITPQGVSPSQHHRWDWNALAWIDPRTLDDLKHAKHLELNAACQSQIYSGYESAALGAPHHYPANDKDQSNMIASVTSSLYPGLPAEWVTPFWCADGSGVWAYRPHTAAQIQQAGADGKAAILAALSKNAVLQARVAAATTIDELNAVEWNP